MSLKYFQQNTPFYPAGDYKPVDSGLHASGYSSSSSLSPSSFNYTINYTSNEVTTQNSVIPIKEKKIYPCNQCPKFFNRPSALETHGYTHTQEKPFQCLSPNCGRRFSVVSNLRRHFKVHKKGSNNVSKISPQERLHCVRKLIKKSSKSLNATDQVPPNISGSLVNTALDYKDIDSQGLLSTIHIQNLAMLPPIIVEDTITQYTRNRQMVAEREDNLVLQKSSVYSAAPYNVGQLIGERPACVMYQQPDLNEVFAQFDEFNFLSQS